ncbi:sensor histidine kinase [Cohnella endophytica]|uniref:sensor histidine kinase n=1 Tax=Cohnella endophytica TaxID=2419778 RepID=UPI001313FF52|nr:histidine kinase N-terminal 7TM domain-containing protein [Cohnella endophytica]
MDIRNSMSLLLFLATALMGFVSYLSYRKRHLRVSRTMIFVMLAAAFYSFGYAFEILSTTLRGTRIALQIEYIGIPFVTAFWLLLVIQFTGGAAARLRKRYLILLFVIPVITFLSHLTNEWHHLFYREYVLSESDGDPIYMTIKGPLYRLHGFYNYLVLIFGTVLFVPMYLRSLPVVRKQILILILGAMAPLLFNFAYLFDRTIDYTPFGFAVSGLAYVWGIFRFDLLRLTPLAFAKVFETIGDGVVLLDYEGRIVSYNGAAEKVFPELSSAPSPAYGKDVLSGHPDLLRRIDVSNTRDERFPFSRSHADRDRHYICSLSFIYENGGITPVGKIMMFNEITELKENEERLRENARQLSQLNAFKDKLFTVMAHDIRDPIALLVSLTELLEEEPTDTDIAQAEVFHEIKRQVSGTFHLVDNLLDWYRSQNGKIAFRPSAWNVQQVVRQALSLAGARAGMKQIRMTEHIDETLAVNADKEMLDLILRNLLSNAIKYTDVGGIIEIGASREGSLVKVSVRDNGRGIDEETAKALRQEEMFFKEPRFENGGDGGEMRFGLVLTREFLRIHGGGLQFESEPGQGTTFLFTLPGALGGGGTNESERTAVKVYESHIG